MLLYKQFKEEWFLNEKWWFTPTENDDIYICNKYSTLLNNDCDDLLTNILINDQLTRHYKRVSNIDIIDKRLIKALDYSDRIIKGDIIKNDLLTWKEWGFILLPFRHAGLYILQITKYIINELKYNKNIEESDIIFLRKYLKATFMRNPNKYLPLDENLYLNNIDYNNILEYTGNNTAIMSVFREEVIKKEPEFIISLSGGVDSMLLAYKYKHNSVAVHIDYNNRKESKLEAKFVQDWCNNNGIKCFTRTISEINRETCMELGLRDLYESYTKQVRFDTYLAVWKSLGKIGNPQVILGHHLDDCVENIICNISKERWRDLNGMDYNKMLKIGGSNFNIIRPLINIHKIDIIKEARDIGIPYLLDTTNKKCSRGKLRNNVIPALLDWRGKQAIDGLYNLAKMTDQANELVKILVNDYVKKLNSGGLL